RLAVDHSQIGFASIQLRQDNIQKDQINGVAVSFEDVDRLLPIFCRQHAVSETLQYLLGRVAQVVVVFRDENAFRSPAHGEYGLFFSYVGRTVAKRQVNAEGRSQARRAVHVNEALVLLDDAVDGGQSQTGAAAGLFCGKERLENVRQRLGVHANA